MTMEVLAREYIVGKLGAEYVLVSQGRVLLRGAELRDKESEIYRAILDLESKRDPLAPRRGDLLRNAFAGETADGKELDPLDSEEFEIADEIAFQLSFHSAIMR